MLRASTIYKIIKADSEHIHMGDVVLAWDDDELSSFKCGVFEGYDHTKHDGEWPFLVKVDDTVLPYSHIRRVPDSLVDECGIKYDFAKQMFDRPINYEEGA